MEGEEVVEARSDVHRFPCIVFPRGPREEQLADLAENFRRRSRPALEGLGIDGEEAELRAVAVEPLEVVEERPVEVAGNRNARSLCFGERRETGPQERGPEDVGTVRDAVL